MKKEISDKIEEMNRLFVILHDYWPSFSAQPTMAEAWAFALMEYPKREIWVAIEEFRGDIEREFAPPISKLIGTMDANREIARREQANLLALEPPKKNYSEDETVETYSYLTSRTTHKIKKDDLANDTRQAMRVTKSRQKELAEQKIRAGLVKKIIKLQNGKTGYEWGRP